VFNAFIEVSFDLDDQRLDDHTPTSADSDCQIKPCETHRMSHSKRRGFTLIELLVVIAIIGAVEGRAEQGGRASIEASETN
jgi:prepilin-type N-terminal cleavage/methylation domain-containing protein